PAERKLAEQLQVGRPVIREAIKVLTTLGILEARGGSGTYVKSDQPAEQFAPDSCRDPNPHSRCCTCSRCWKSSNPGRRGWRRHVRESGNLPKSRQHGSGWRCTIAIGSSQPGWIWNFIERSSVEPKTLCWSSSTNP